MGNFFKKLKAVFRVFNAFKSLCASIKSAISLVSLPLVGWALVVVAVIAIVSIAANYEELRKAISQMRSQYISTNAPVGGQFEIKTSVTKDDPDWLGKYCSEQAAKLPPPPFKYKKRTEEGKWLIITSLGVGKRLPKDENGYEVDSLTCRVIYSYDPKEAWPSMGVNYVIDIKSSNEFEKKVDEIYTLSMDPTWEKISSLGQEETGRPFYSYQGFPLLFKRENPKLGTVEYAEMAFAIDYWVKFTVYEAQNKK
jgi:hypothetical protein